MTTVSKTVNKSENLFQSETIEVVGIESNEVNTEIENTTTPINVEVLSDRMHEEKSKETNAVVKKSATCEKIVFLYDKNAMKGRNKNSQYECTICQMKGDNRSHMINHIKNKHPNHSYPKIITTQELQKSPETKSDKTVNKSKTLTQSETIEVNEVELNEVINMDVEVLSDQVDDYGLNIIFLYDKNA